MRIHFLILLKDIYLFRTLLDLYLPHTLFAVCLIQKDAIKI
ncbi:hypothetical protein METSMIF1_03377 [Methanobrevibacter smithii DSM 2374]|uniref:Uncharacterized protein n=1 Tax=Methanobrevibacter smithii DSM 2374 TaxID=521002 RepID=D2ZR95_METSM|nr:hypothetical protein METSMIF1_03377 [Methanobrevibacter smithii DSM 2374]